MGQNLEISRVIGDHITTLSRLAEHADHRFMDWLMPGNEGLELLRERCEVRVATGLGEDALCARLADVDALIVRSETKVTARVLEAAPRLVVVGRAGVGVDNIDVPAATRLGVYVVNAPTGNVAAAAEHALALMLALLGANVYFLRKGLGLKQ